MSKFTRFLKFASRALRELCGENDYSRYRASVLARSGKPPTEGAFFLERLERKYAQPNRCC